MRTFLVIIGLLWVLPVQAEEPPEKPAEKPAAPEAAAGVTTTAEAEEPGPTEGGARKAGGLHPGGALGVGLSVGREALIDAKYWYDHRLAFTAGLGTLTADLNNAVVEAGALYHFYLPGMNAKGPVRVPFYAGGSLELVAKFPVEAETLWMLGVKATVGATVLTAELPVDFFVELSPTAFVFLDQNGFGIDARVGLRYYF